MCVFFAYLSSAQFSSAHGVALALFLILTAAHIANDFGSHTRSRVLCSHVHHRCVAYTQRGLLLLLLHKLKTLCATSFVLKCCAVVANVMLPVIVVASEIGRVYVVSGGACVCLCVCCVFCPSGRKVLDSPSAARVAFNAPLETFPADQLRCYLRGSLLI